jgi:hypothetical protein
MCNVEGMAGHADSIGFAPPVFLPAAPIVLETW